MDERGARHFAVQQARFHGHYSLLTTEFKQHKEPLYKSRMTAKPEAIRTLKNWVARWPRDKSLGFDPETREPTVFSLDAARMTVSAIPWKREGDTLTVLADPARFAPAAVEAAGQRYGRYRQQLGQIVKTAEVQLRAQEGILLEAWRAYHSAPAASRGVLQRDIMAAEKALAQMEAALAGQRYSERKMRSYEGDYTGIFNPSMPTGRRAIPLESIGSTPVGSTPVAAAED
jgi:hypothetical protein